MFYKFGALIVVLAVCAGSLMADDKDKKEAKKEAIKGTVSKFDYAKRSVTLKMADGEKDYPVADEVLVVLGTGHKVTAKKAPPSAGKTADRILLFVFKVGNQVELVLAENTVKEIHFDNRPPAPQK
jgi:hypothetical protein